MALPLHEEYGTQPNVFYVPLMSGPKKFDKTGKPIEGSDRIPVEYLESLFGPNVKTALKTLQDEIDRRKAGKASELTDLLIAYKHSDMFRLNSKPSLSP